MKISTLRFGELEISDEEVITFPEGILGFQTVQRYCLVDQGDDTLILWLQAIDDPSIAFPVLEPKIFKDDYVVKLSAQELKQLRLESVNQSIVFSILTIPRDVTQMTANVKAPIVINLRDHFGKQVVLQENEYTIKHPMFIELKRHLTTISANKPKTEGARAPATLPVNLRSMLPSNQIRLL